MAAIACFLSLLIGLRSHSTCHQGNMQNNICNYFHEGVRGSEVISIEISNLTICPFFFTAFKVANMTFEESSILHMYFLLQFHVSCDS